MTQRNKTPLFVYNLITLYHIIQNLIRNISDIHIHSHSSHFHQPTRTLLQNDISQHNRHLYHLLRCQQGIRFISRTCKYYSLHHEFSNDNLSCPRFNSKIMNSHEKQSISTNVSSINSSTPIIVYSTPISLHNNSY